jgi:hypothetical protein
MGGFVDSAVFAAICRVAGDAVSEGGQHVIPEGFDVDAQRGDPFGSDAVDAARALLAGLHETRLAEDTEVLRDGRLADRQCVGQFADGSRSFAYALEDSAARGIGEGAERLDISHSLYK